MSSSFSSGLLFYSVPYWISNKHLKLNLAETGALISPRWFFCVIHFRNMTIYPLLQLEYLNFLVLIFFHNSYPKFKHILPFPSEYTLNFNLFMPPPAVPLRLRNGCLSPGLFQMLNGLQAFWFPICFPCSRQREHFEI